VVVDFWAVWCGPCRIMAPIIDEVARELKGKVKFGKVNVDEEGELAERFEVMSIPTLIFFKKGRQVERITGAIEEDELMDIIKKLK
jgi:thioredoxin 1